MTLASIHPNESNPRTIDREQIKKLKNSIVEFPAMMELRPIVVDSSNTILGGNMRYNALMELGYKEIPDTWVKQASELTDEEKKRFIIADNVGFGAWDYDVLFNEWDVEKLEVWGLDLPEKTATELLSVFEFKDCYYTPEHEPNISLRDCINMELHDVKIQAINDADCSDEFKQTMKILAGRFIRIDYERIANYYFFNASEQEKKVMERLRLVLCDSGIVGFIEDDLLRLHEVIEGYND